MSCWKLQAGVNLLHHRISPVMSSTHKSCKVFPKISRVMLGEKEHLPFCSRDVRPGLAESRSQLPWVRVVQYWSQLGLSHFLTFMSTKYV